MSSAARELEMAKKEYREAYDAGDSEKLVEAQEKMTSAKIKADRALSIKDQRASQKEESEVQIPQQRQQPIRDNKAESWRENNSWFGQDDEMTSFSFRTSRKACQRAWYGLCYDK